MTANFRLFSSYIIYLVETFFAPRPIQFPDSLWMCIQDCSLFMEWSCVGGWNNNLFDSQPYTKGSLSSSLLADRFHAMNMLQWFFYVLFELNGWVWSTSSYQSWGFILAADCKPRGHANIGYMIDYGRKPHLLLSLCSAHDNESPFQTLARDLVVEDERWETRGGHIILAIGVWTRSRLRPCSVIRRDEKEEYK